MNRGMGLPKLFLLLIVCSAFASSSSAAEADSRPNGALAHARELAAAGRVKEAMAEVEDQLPSLNDAMDKASALEMLGDLILDAHTMSAFTNALRHYDWALAVAPGRAGLQLKRARLLFQRAEFH